MYLYSIILFMIFIHYSSMIASLATAATRKCLVRDACKYTSIHIHMRSHVLAIKHAPLFAAQRAAEETKVRCGRCCFVVKKKRKKERMKKSRTARRRHRGALLMSPARWMPTQHWFCVTSPPPRQLLHPHYSPTFPFISHFPLHFNANLGEANKLVSCHI